MNRKEKPKFLQKEREREKNTIIDMNNKISIIILFCDNFWKHFWSQCRINQDLI